jgi:hypothetical protein
MGSELTIMSLSIMATKPGLIQKDGNAQKSS